MLHSSWARLGFSDKLLVGSLGQDLPEVHQTLLEYIKRNKPQYRALGLSALALGWTSDPSVLGLLLDHLADVNSDVRFQVPYALATNFRGNQQTLKPLLNSALNESDDFVKSITILSLAFSFSGNSDVFDFLYNLANDAPDPYSRLTALEALTLSFHDNPQTLTLIRERAVKDSSPLPDEEMHSSGHYVRYDAVRFIANYWTHHPDTLPLLRERVQNDPTPWLRENAKKLADSIEQGKPIDEITKE